MNIVDSLVRQAGFEPARRPPVEHGPPPDSKSGATANFATAALWWTYSDSNRGRWMLSPSVGQPGTRPMSTIEGAKAYVLAPSAFRHNPFPIICTLPAFLFPSRPKRTTRIGLLFSTTGSPLSTTFSTSSSVVCTWPSSRSLSSRLLSGVVFLPSRLVWGEALRLAELKSDFWMPSHRALSSLRRPRSEDSTVVSAFSRSFKQSRSADTDLRRSCRSCRISRIDVLDHHCRASVSRSQGRLTPLRYVNEEN